MAAIILSDGGIAAGLAASDDFFAVEFV